MTSPTWHDRLKDLWSLLAFLGRLPDETKTGEAKSLWKRELRRELSTRDDETLDAFAARWQARYDEIETVRGTITSRAGSLLLFVGVLSTGAGLIAQSLTGAPGLVVVMFVVVGVFLLYSGLAAAVLAVRAQRVSQWDSPRVDVADATNPRMVRLKYAVEIFVAADQNQIRLRTPVALLRDGQSYAMAGIVLIALLAVLSVAAAILKPPADTESQEASASLTTVTASSPWPVKSPLPISGAGANVGMCGNGAALLDRLTG